MALVRMDEILIPARKEKRAVGAFECWDSNSAQVITKAAVLTDCPVIIQATPGEYDYVGGPEVLRRIVEIYVNN
jgi:fructose/tagatose bisphosphate aldolase